MYSAQPSGHWRESDPKHRAPKRLRKEGEASAKPHFGRLGDAIQSKYAVRIERSSSVLWSAARACHSIRIARQRKLKLRRVNAQTNPFLGNVVAPRQPVGDAQPSTQHLGRRHAFFDRSIVAIIPSRQTGRWGDPDAHRDVYLARDSGPANGALARGRSSWNFRRGPPADLILRVLTRRIIEIGTRNQTTVAPEQFGRSRKRPHIDGQIRQDAQRPDCGPDAEVYAMRRYLDIAGLIVSVFVQARKDEGACEDTRRLFAKDDGAMHALARDNASRAFENGIANCFL